MFTPKQKLFFLQFYMEYFINYKIKEITTERFHFKKKKQDKAMEIVDAIERPITFEEYLKNVEKFKEKWNLSIAPVLKQFIALDKIK